MILFSDLSGIFLYVFLFDMVSFKVSILEARRNEIVRRFSFRLSLLDL